MSKLKNKVAIVTGASKGIGAAIAKHLADEGASVIVNYVSSKEGAEQVVKAITSNGGKAFAIQADISSQSDVKKLFEETKKTFGSLDILVNNAGIYEFAPIEEFTDESFHKQFNVNVLGSLFAIQEAIKAFDTTGGSIINISSEASSSPQPNGAVYSATKAALDAVTVSLSKELSGKNIRINSVLPGIVETEGYHTLGMPSSDAEAFMVSKTSLGRVGRPDDIAKVVGFLASDDSYWITGERISTTGGLYGI